MVKYLPHEKVKYLAVHCTASPLGRDDNAATIHRWHIERGWDLIGYHAVILEDGTVERGRPLYCQGAHCPAINDCSISACLFGEREFTDAEFISLRELLLQWQGVFPGAEVIGHNDVDPKKSCPNFDVKVWWQDVNKEYP